MKRLIVCCDGTWNNPAKEDNGIPAPTNVFKMYNALADHDARSAVKQHKYYHPGVGGEGGLLNAIIGGAVGAGISRHICSAYHWLGSNYEEGDHIYLFGFSRGAFTARSLGGFLGQGLLNLRNLSSNEAWLRVHRAYEQGYRGKNATPTDWAEPQWNFFHQGQPAPIRFVGVWDTVGALGVPDDLEFLNFFDDKAKWEFHNTEIGGNVATARHAMALDEIRSCFCVTRWQNAAQHPDTVELWFPGAHSDVGGGYAGCDLSNGALLWMMEESAKTGLKFRDNIQETIKADPLGAMHNSYKGLFAKLRSRPRNIEAMIPENHARFHAGAITRQLVSPITHPAYHPTKILAVGESIAVDIFADTHWNYSSVYLPQGHSFTFSATGQWQDSTDTCDWRGTENKEMTVGDLIRGAASLFGTLERTFKKLLKNEATDLPGTKRVEKLNWFTLVGAIANDAGLKQVVGNDGSPVPHQYVELAAHASAPLTITAPGYLYCFANDAWNFYGNNHGSVQLTIHRVS